MNIEELRKQAEAAQASVTQLRTSLDAIASNQGREVWDMAPTGVAFVDELRKLPTSALSAVVRGALDLRKGLDPQAALHALGERVDSLRAELAKVEQERDDARAQQVADRNAIADAMSWARDHSNKMPPSSYVKAVVEALRLTREGLRVAREDLRKESERYHSERKLAEHYKSEANRLEEAMKTFMKVTRAEDEKLMQTQRALIHVQKQAEELRALRSELATTNGVLQAAMVKVIRNLGVMEEAEFWAKRASSGYSYCMRVNLNYLRDALHIPVKKDDA